MDEGGVRERVARVEEALEELEGLPSGPRTTALDAVSALVELYGEGWARALARLEEERPGSAARLAEDELVSHLLMIHGLHPTGVAGRARQALAALEETLDAEGTGVELVEVEEGVARLRFGPDGGAPPPGVRDLVAEAVLQAAPELEDIAVEGADGASGSGRAAGDGGGQGLVQLEVASEVGEGSEAGGAS